MFARLRLCLPDGSLGRYHELTPDPRTIFLAREKTLRRRLLWRASWRRDTPLHMLLSNIGRASIISEQSPSRWTVESDLAPWNMRCILGQSNCLVFLFGLFFTEILVREKEKGSRRKDEELDGLFIQGNRVGCYLSSKFPSGLPYYDCNAKSPLTVSGIALLARIYVRSCTHG